MTKLREPAVFQMDNISFYVDLDRQTLRQTDNPDNEISFIHQMQDMGDHYMLAWDAKTKNAAANSEDGEPLIIPQLSLLDPEGMSEKYRMSVSEMAGKSDFEIIVDQEALAARQNGILPQIDIAGEKFIFDLRLQELRHVEYFFPVISLKSLDLTDDGWHYEAFYEPIMKQVVQLDPKLTEFPDGIIKIKMPNEIGLDPVGTARIYGMSERELLRRHPIQKELKAEVIPLSETQVPRLIRQNREQLQREHEQITRKMKPGKRPRF
ncbi:hypothetical protein ACFQZI_11135 [Mucilaginibacter lutimaris]|uniref:DUF4316 domain-containing protein n=1 Tax=Mucilaginibacter lutimaris TaxID=931629 RepID=A0ABW2ZGT4_9SPHI